VLRTGSELHSIKTKDIVWMEAQADFVKVHTTRVAQLVRESPQDLEERGKAAEFLRIHRSTLMKGDHIKKVTPGDYTVLMSDDTKRRMSLKNRGKLKQLITQLSSPKND
jgi:two-component system, LytTR family, response regulator